MPKTFNLKRAQVPNPAAPEDPFGADVMPEGVAQEQDYLAGEEAQEAEVFNSRRRLMDRLDAIGDPITAREEIVDPISSDHEVVSEDGTSRNAKELAAQNIERYYQIDPINEREREEIADLIYEATSHMEPEEDVPATYREEPDASEVFGALKTYIKTSEDQIKALAKKAVQEKKSVNKQFNLSKTAQHHTVDNAFLWGPGEKRYDPFYRQPVSDWHIVERNKGFGLTVDDFWNIDWEALWRGNVMDKYSRPYRDKDGNWVGGYIQKRFEVDKSIPETSNMQLKPGQRRKPRPPEYGVIEGRLQAMRAKNERGYGPDSDTSQPFNWKAAQAKIAQIPVPHTNGHEDLALDKKLNQLRADLEALEAEVLEQTSKKDMLQHMTPEEFEEQEREMDEMLAEKMTPEEEEFSQKHMLPEQRKFDPGAFRGYKSKDQVKTASPKKKVK